MDKLKEQNEIKTISALISGPGCSKLTTSLVNISLNFQTLVSRVCRYFLLKKCSAKASLIFSTKNFTVFSNEVVK